jgi:CDP-diacylglycerol--serine O-phosphatidyltransferase
MLKKTKAKDKIKGKTTYPLPIYRLFPSIITIIALCAGLTSIRYGFDHKWEYSMLLLIIAAFLDVMDGRVARYLQVTSDFGAQIDSLADFLNFGIAPAITLYLWALHSIPTKGIGWGFVLVFVVCCAIRLARFNAMMHTAKERQPWQESFFVGMPSTIGGIMVTLPLMISIEWPEIQFVEYPKSIGCYMIMIAFAMASRIPTFSIKKLYVAQDKVALVLALIALLIAALLIEPWITISTILVLYILSIPVSIKIYYKLFKQHKTDII